jgi:hypothetical protein
VPAFRWIVVLSAFALSLLGLTAGPADARARRCLDDYTYAGMMGRQGVHGVSARITPLRSPQVAGGHVAAWVGIGGEGLGPGGTTEWLQAGLSAFDDGRIALYYEVALPGSDARYVALGDGRAAHTVAVGELRRRPNWWRVWVDGQPASPAFHLPGSHGTFTPTATTESWDGGTGACNTFAYRFTGLAVSSGGADGWQPLRRPQVIVDPGVRMERRRDGFQASAPA